jgi:hypothetical protein
MNSSQLYHIRSMVLHFGHSVITENSVGRECRLCNVKCVIGLDHFASCSKYIAILGKMSKIFTCKTPAELHVAGAAD